MTLVFLSQVILSFVDRLFTGMTVVGCHQFRVTRNAELWVDDEEPEDLLRAVEGELASRRYGDAVCLETTVDCPPKLRDFLLERFELGPEDHYVMDGPVNLNRLMAIYDLVDRGDLKYEPFAPAVPQRLVGRQDVFETIREKDILLHHPFHSFAPVIDLLRQSAADPQVLAIKQTLYRTGPDSPVVDALVEAARNGKEVTVVIELMARFDEAHARLTVVPGIDSGSAARKTTSPWSGRTGASPGRAPRKRRGVWRKWPPPAPS